MLQCKQKKLAFDNDGLFDNSKGTMTIITGAAAWALGKDGQYTA
jgi:hypothetical protein